jgi:hypothetical protein
MLSCSRRVRILFHEILGICVGLGWFQCVQTAPLLLLTQASTQRACRCAEAAGSRQEVTGQPASTEFVGADDATLCGWTGSTMVMSHDLTVSVARRARSHAACYSIRPPSHIRSTSAKQWRSRTQQSRQQLTRQVLLCARVVPVRAWRSAGQDKSRVHKANLQQAAATQRHVSATGS